MCVCGHSCGPGRCVNQECVCPPPPWKNCNGDCLDTSIDQLNCGDCDNRCFPGETCCNGECACNCTTMEKCSPIETCCSGTCVNLQTDNPNCGACGVPCRIAVSDAPQGAARLPTASVLAGKCTCGLGLIFTGDKAFGAPVCCPPSTPDWCQSNAGCFCVNKNTDPNNCGKCGNTCSYQAPGEPDVMGICSGGLCKCPPGWLACEVDSRGDDITCCPQGYDCQQTVCCPKGTLECPPGPTGEVGCCPPSELCCGDGCCAPGQACCAGRSCCTAGLESGGPVQTCCDWSGVCCTDAVERCCGSGCCPLGQTCCFGICCPLGFPYCCDTGCSDVPCTSMPAVPS